MDRDRRLSLTVGGFAIAAVAALALAILSLTSQQGVWTERYRLVTYFDNVQGLIGSAPVWLAGTRVGRVEAVDLAPRPDGKPAVKVVLQIDESVQHRIREDSVATIGTIGLLGDRYVEISMGTPQAPALEDGDELSSVSPIDVNVVIDRGAEALDSIASLAARLDDVVADFDEGMGGRRLADAAGSISALVTEVESGSGLLHSLIYDEYEGSGVQSIERSLATLEGILNEVAYGDGILHTLIYDAPTEQDIVLEALEAGSKLNSILGKVDRGEGSLGLMLNDPTLYEEFKLLVRGARRSRVVRTLIDFTASGE